MVVDCAYTTWFFFFGIVVCPSWMVSTMW